MDAKEILVGGQFQFTIDRLCHQIIENHPNPANLCIIGIQEKGVLMMQRIKSVLIQINASYHPKFGKLDITFYRDDFRRREKPLKANTTEINFLIEGQDVILIDDVLYSGRTVHAAMTAVQDFGRPERIEMMCMVDRRFNRLFPIKADYVGISVDALNDAYVRVHWQESDDVDKIMLYAQK